MNLRLLATTLMVGTMAFPLSTVAQTTTRDQAKDQTRLQTQDRIYGSQLMTQQEMNEYRERVRLAKTEQERDRIRAEHHDRMAARAKERGVTLPDEPPARAGAPGPGPGGGIGPGPGSGAGPGGGGGRR